MKKDLKVKALFTRFLILLVSIFLGLFCGEGMVRIIYEPVDYLMPELLEDPILGHRVKPNSAGHDSWGYRNKTVPDAADIVCIGDSQTYGESAKARDSWPAQLQQMIAREVYNLSLGGYSPVEYSYLFSNKTFKLNPSLVVVGFYFGNDLIGAYNKTYSNDYWKDLRRPGVILQKNAKPNVSQGAAQEKNKFLAQIRNWLAHHSILYRIATYSLVGDTFRTLETKYGIDKKNFITINNSEQKILTGLTPQKRLDALNFDDVKILEGKRICLEVFNLMNQWCRKKGVSFLILLIPTKESVFSQVVAKSDNFHDSKIIRKLINDESELNKLMRTYFTTHDIDYIDVLEPLQREVERGQIYPNNFDGHPNKNGYEIIAKTVHQHIVNFIQ